MHAINYRYAQHYSADGFAAASSATLDDDYFMEGVAIARLAADGTRDHIFAAAVGIAYDTANTGFVRGFLICGAAAVEKIAPFQRFTVRSESHAPPPSHSNRYLQIQLPVIQLWVQRYGVLRWPQCSLVCGYRLLVRLGQPRYLGTNLVQAYGHSNLDCRYGFRRRRHH